MSKRVVKPDIFGDSESAVAKDDFATMFEKSLATVGRRLQVGDAFSAEILSISKEEAFVTTPTTKDAMLLTSELLDEKGVVKYKVGDHVDVVVVKLKDGDVRVAKAGSKKSSHDLDSLEDAFDMELPMEGRVVELCNGGFRVSVQGKLAFCPISQMDFKVIDQTAYVDKKFDFLITQLDPKGRNIVVSRRKLLELQKVENEGVFLQSAKEGDILKGTVSRLEKFGAFVTLPEAGVEGLVHISEIGWSRLADPSEVLSVGQEVSVKILRLEEVGEKLKISLSIKQGGNESDPWMLVSQNFPLRSKHQGVVEKKEVYGLFVKLSPSITGLLPKSKWRDSVEAQKYESKKKGDPIEVQVDEILFEQKKMSLGIPTESDDHSWKSELNEKGGKSGSAGFTNAIKFK